MAKILVNVRIGDEDNSNFTKLVQIELNAIDCLVIKDRMEFCDSEEYDKSWNRLILAIEEKAWHSLPREWYIDKIESYQYQ